MLVNINPSPQKLYKVKFFHSDNITAISQKFAAQKCNTSLKTRRLVEIT